MGEPKDIWMDFATASEAEAGNDPREKDDAEKIVHIAVATSKTPKKGARTQIAEVDTTSLSPPQKLVLQRSLENVELQRTIELETAAEPCKCTGHDQCFSPTRRCDTSWECWYHGVNALKNMSV